jgi:hypothetical protein
MPPIGGCHHHNRRGTLVATVSKPACTVISLSGHAQLKAARWIHWPPEAASGLVWRRGRRTPSGRPPRFDVDRRGTVRGTDPILGRVRRRCMPSSRRSPCVRSEYVGVSDATTRLSDAIQPKSTSSLAQRRSPVALPPPPVVARARCARRATHDATRSQRPAGREEEWTVTLPAARVH